MIRDVLQIGICDDSQEALEQIESAVRNSIKRMGIPVNIIFCLYQNGEDMFKADKKQHFDLFLIDIEMPGLDGFQLAKRICSEREIPCVIFVSIHDSYIFDSQKFMPLWFVRKSVLKNDMYQALRKYFEITTLKKARYQLKGGSVYVRDIVYIECSGHSLIIQKKDGKVIKQYGSLKTMEEELSNYNFLRIHKSYLVNPRYIEEIGKQEVRLTNGIALEMGRDRRKSLREAIFKYEGENNEY